MPPRSRKRSTIQPGKGNTGTNWWMMANTPTEEEKPKNPLSQMPRSQVQSQFEQKPVVDVVDDDDPFRIYDEEPIPLKNTQSKSTDNLKGLDNAPSTVKTKKNRVIENNNSVQSKKNKKKEKIKLLEEKSPPIWTVGLLLVFIIILICEFVQNGGYEPMNVNPLFGPSEETMILMGAKYAKNMLNGEGWRFITANFIHSGVIHLVIALVFLITNCDLEIDTGFWRIFFAFFLTGIYGFILSSVIVPGMVSCGANGANFGLFGIQIADLISTWRVHRDNGKRFGCFVACISIGILLGLTPYFDNFCNVGGFAMGIMMSLALLPNLAFGSCERICKGFISFLVFPLLSFVFCFCLVLFFRRVDGNACEWCLKVNCLDYNNWCPKYDDYKVVKIYQE